jgi:lipid-A-disaccharide synthase
MMTASWHVLRHMGYQPWVGLPNIMAREFLVPELLQDAATPEAIADALWRQMEDGVGRQRLRQRFTEMHHALLRDTARLSAQAVLEMISSHQGRL